MNIILFEQQILVHMHINGIDLPHNRDIKTLKTSLQPLYVSDTVFVAHTSDILHDTNEHHNLQFISIRQALMEFAPSIAAKILFYKQLAHYYQTHKYCGTCGMATTPQKHNYFLYCGTCGSETYPHIAPSIIVRIHKNDQILMARGVGFPPGVWGLIAGFVEIGETLEEAVARETFEEVGLKIKNIRYFGSQPWPFPGNSLMIGFTAEYDSGSITIQDSEIEKAGFFNRDNLPGRPSTSYSIANTMLDDFLNL